MLKLVFLGFGLALLGPVAAVADERCFVADPTGTPLNVRDRPYGRILGALANGAAVRKMESTTDRDGRVWSFVAPLGPGRSGWVYREYISCD
ncbi:MAG: peptide-binding protein [Rhodoblastus sp.]|nr:peptide-binding protein [Rhodoblastus sp.]